MEAGIWQFGRGKQDDSESIAAIYRALELGINSIDTAAIQVGVRGAQQVGFIGAMEFRLTDAEGTEAARR